MGRRRGAAARRSAARQAAAATAPELFKKVLREAKAILTFSSRPALALDLLCGHVPRGHVPIQIGMICHVACDSRMIAKNLVLHHVFARLHSAEEIRYVIGSVVVTLRR